MSKVGVPWLGGNMSRNGPRIVLFLSVVLIPNACESRGEPGGTPSLVTLGPEAPPGWNVQEITRIGSVDGAEEESSFGSIRGVELDAEGNVYVLDTHAVTVRVFASDGRYLRSIGREGSGPGEFRRPTGILLTPDGRLWVANSGNGRYDVFERDGTLAGTYRKTVRGSMGSWDAGATEDGVIYEPRGTLFVAGTERHQVYLGFVPVDGSAEPVDVVQRDAPAPPPVWSVRAGTAGGGVYEAGMVPVPFATTFHDRFDSRRGYWTATTDRMRFVRRSLEGDTLLVVERDVAPRRPVTTGDIDTAVRDLTARFGEGLQVDRSLVPSAMPYWEVFLVDDAGRLWVQRFEYHSGQATRPATWEVYEPNGTFLGELMLPVAKDPLPIVRHNWLAGVVRDEFGVDFVVLYDLGVPMG